MALTTEQVLILNNLMYLESGKDSPVVDMQDCSGQTIGDWLNKIDVNQLENDRNYGSFTTGQDWKNIIQAAKDDETLMNMTIAATHSDSAGGGGQSAVFTSSSTGDAVVAFQGTQGQKEWADNFQGGNVTDTPCQENALEWYQSAYQEYGLENYEVTITGHSKGGNKAKYITLLDDTVDYCVSFDGQGFSDEFMTKYASQIAARQSRIENHNVDYDYVNLLLNDVGESTFYNGQDYGKGGFLENHCPNTFMKFDENGSFTMQVNPNGQASEMKALDEFLNNLIRSMPEDQQTSTLGLINVIWDNASSLDGKSGTEIANIFLQLAADPQYSGDLAYVAAYLIEYEQAHPEFKDQINSVLREFNMGDAVQYVDMVDEILNFNEDYFLIGRVDFDRLYSWITGAAGALPDGVLNWLLGILKDKTGITLTLEQLKNLLALAGKTYDDMQRIEIRDNGGDVRVPGVGESGSNIAPHGRTMVDLRRMRSISEAWLDLARLLERLSGDTESIAGNLHISQRHMATLTLRTKLLASSVGIRQISKRADVMGNSLMSIAGKYEKAELTNLSLF